MSDLVDDPYQQGLKIHKSGKIELACQVYSLVLNANPEHSMANHNMGALAVDIGKVQGALPSFEATLEANADVAQFWVSWPIGIKLNPYHPPLHETVQCLQG